MKNATTVHTKSFLPFLCLVALIAAAPVYCDEASAVEASKSVLSVYITEPITSKKILPDTPVTSFPLAGKADDTTIKISACRGEFEPASFVIRPSKPLTNITITASDLKGPNGVVIPSSAINVRLVKCWYQAGTDVYLPRSGPGKVLVPELLLKDDSLVRIDPVAQMNYLRVRNNGIDQYVDITSRNAQFPAGAEIHDAATLQPFDLKADVNKQLWLTFKVPTTSVNGRYTGRISVNAGTTLLTTLSIALTVLPFALEKPVIDYALYYRGIVQSVPPKVINADNKSLNQYKIELQNMKDHGVVYPTLYQPYDTMLSTALSIRGEVGLPTDRLYVLGQGTGNISDAVWLRSLSRSINKWKNTIAPYGYQSLYIYGTDEAKASGLLKQTDAWRTTHGAGALVFAACYKGAVDIVGSTLDLPILSGQFDPGEVAKWHSAGKKVMIYGNPQVGVEDALLYRRNYGIALVCNGYDGTMNYAYQHGFGGSIWNDFDSPTLRDHVFAYPTSDGVIDTIQWEGWREAVNDVRYLTTLAKAKGVSVYPSLCSLLSSTGDADSVRKTIVDSILAQTSAAR